MLAGKPATNRQPDRHEVVTHVSGTICYLCLRSGQCPTRVVGRTRTMLHNTLVLVQVSESQENQAKQQNSRNLDGCPTRGAGRTPTMFHNTLVVSSSPTSSTTQSPATGETTGLALGRKLGMSGR